MKKPRSQFRQTIGVGAQAVRGRRIRRIPSYSVSLFAVGLVASLLLGLVPPAVAGISIISSTAGIHGGDNSLRGILGGDRQLFDTIVMGPVDAVDSSVNGPSITILGQVFLTASDLTDFSVGDYVVAAGESKELTFLLSI